MSEQKSTQLSPEEWKQLCVLNCQQLLNFLSSVPAMGMIEGSDVPVSGMTAERITEIDNHLMRGKQFLMAWARSRPVGVAQPKEAEAAPARANGAEPVRKPGWPKGKKRTPRVQTEAVQ